MPTTAPATEVPHAALALDPPLLEAPRTAMKSGDESHLLSSTSGTPCANLVRVPSAHSGTFAQDLGKVKQSSCFPLPSQFPSHDCRQRNERNLIIPTVRYTGWVPTGCTNHPSNPARKEPAVFLQGRMGKSSNHILTCVESMLILFEVMKPLPLLSTVADMPRCIPLGAGGIPAPTLTLDAGSNVCRRGRVLIRRGNGGNA